MAQTAEPKLGFFGRIVQYTHEVRGEIRKVTWPTRSELWGATIVVGVVTLVMSMALGLLDAMFSAVINQIIGMLGK